ncbi:MAG: hypothetical protein AB7O50_13955 [Pseudolabrys sp.]
MADCWVRLGFALTAIVLVTAAFYQASNPGAVAIETASPQRR